MLKDNIYLECENYVCELFEEKKVFTNSNYQILDKFEKDINQLEFLDSNQERLILSYYLDENDYELVIVIEEDRILYLILDNNNSIIEESIIKESLIFF